MEEFIEFKTVTATGFTSSLGSVSNIPIKNVVYTYYATDGTVLPLECNKLINLGQKMSDSLLNPIQAEKVGILVDTRPKQYYPNDVGFKSLYFPDGINILVLYEGVLPYIPIIFPKKNKSTTFDD